MKFQNNASKSVTNGRTDGRKEGRTDGRTNNPEAICPSNFFEVGGIITEFTLNTGTFLPLSC